MTNFLDRLVGRAVTAPSPTAVRPRVRSRFEPAAFDARRAAPLGSTVTGLDEVEHERDAAPPPAPGERGDPSRAPASVSRETPAQPPPGDSPSARRAAPLRPHAPAPPQDAQDAAQRARTTRPVAPAPPPAESARPPRPTLARHQRDPGPARGEGPSHARAATVARSPARDGDARRPQPGAPDPAGRRGALDPRPLPGSGTPGSVPAPRNDQTPAAAAPMLRSTTARRAVPPTTRAPAPEHVVHVTIGRLEVRSAPPAAPAAPARATPRRPPVALDDYLRERTDGRRR